MLIVLSALITGKLGACRLCKNPVAFRSTVQSMLVNTFTHFFHHNDKVVEDVYVKSNSGKCSIAFIFHFLVFRIRKIQQNGADLLLLLATCYQPLVYCLFHLLASVTSNQIVICPCDRGFNFR